MNKFNLHEKFKGALVASIFLAFSLQGFAQGGGFDLTAPGKTLQTALEGVFPYIAGIGAIWVIFKQLNHFGEGEDYWKGVKNIAIYIFVVVALSQGYKYVTTLSLR